MIVVALGMVEFGPTGQRQRRRGRGDPDTEVSDRVMGLFNGGTGPPLSPTFRMITGIPGWSLLPAGNHHRPPFSTTGLIRQKTRPGLRGPGFWRGGARPVFAGGTLALARYRHALDAFHQRSAWYSFRWQANFAGRVPCCAATGACLSRRGRGAVFASREPKSTLTIRESSTVGLPGWTVRGRARSCSY